MSDKWDPMSPGSDTDFHINIYKRLATGEIIDTVTWTPVDGLTFHNQSIDDYVDGTGAVIKTKAIASVWIQCDTEGTYTIPVKIVTNSVPPRSWTLMPVLKVKPEVYK